MMSGRKLLGSRWSRGYRWYKCTTWGLAVVREEVPSFHTMAIEGLVAHHGMVQPSGANVPAVKCPGHHALYALYLDLLRLIIGGKLRLLRGTC